MGVLLRGGLFLGLRCFDVVDVGGLGWELLVLLDSARISMMCVGCCVSGGVTSPGVSLGNGGLKSARRRLRVLACVVYVWRSREYFVMC